MSDISIQPTHLPTTTHFTSLMADQKLTDKLGAISTQRELLEASRALIDATIKKLENMIEKVSPGENEEDFTKYFVGDEEGEWREYPVDTDINPIRLPPGWTFDRNPFGFKATWTKPGGQTEIVRLCDEQVYATSKAALDEFLIEFKKFNGDCILDTDFECGDF